jgi:fumarate reductase subunit C
MSEPAPANPRYTPYHPRWHRRRMPIFWWLGRLSYTRFITRELTSLAVAYTALFLLAALCALAYGEADWEAFLARLRHPGWVAFHAGVFLFLLFHTVTWLGLAPKALVLKVGRRRLPDAAVVAGHYAAWAAASALVAAFFLWRTG